MEAAQGMQVRDLALQRGQPGMRVVSERKVSPSESPSKTARSHTTPLPPAI